jgi:Na+/H+-dicarboxylate symporter
MILGFVIKMQYEDVLDELINNYAYIFSMVAILQLVYILPWYVILAKFKTSVWLNYFKNMVPPFITGFSTLSSAATMPLTLIATRKNVHDPDVVNFVIPTTVNFHLIGDCLAMPIFAMALMLSFGYELPSMGAYLIFSLYYVLARFSAAAIPGGGAIVIWPLLMSQFGFTSDMLALIHTLNLVFDPMITSMNIMGNGAFAILFNMVFHWSKGSKAPTPIQA